MGNSTVNALITSGVVAILASCVAGLLWIIKFLFTRLIPRLDKGNEVMEGLVEATKLNTRAVKSADDSRRIVRTRDTKIAEQLIKTTKESHDTMIKAVQDIPTQIIKSAALTAKAIHETPPSQKIDKQEVNTQIVNGKK
jgi:hypothetical protein